MTSTPNDTSVPTDETPVTPSPDHPAPPVPEQSTQTPLPVKPSTESTGSRRPSNRFVMNKVEKAWVLMQLLALGAPVQKLKTLDATCARVAESARTRHVADSVIVSEQNCYGMSWRRSHMLRITGENVRHVANTIPEMAKKVVITSMSGSLEVGGPIAAARGKEEDVQHVLDQVVLDFKHEASKKTLTTDEDAEKALNRIQESRAQKQKRNSERKATFEANKRRRQELREARERRRMAADLQNLRAQTRVANAATASAALQRRQSEQFGILVNLFAQSNTLPTQQPSTPLPPPLSTDPLVIDPGLLANSVPNVAPTTDSNHASGLSADAVTDASSSPPVRENEDGTGDVV